MLRETASCICGEENQTTHDIIYHYEVLRPPHSFDDLVPPGSEGVNWLLVGPTCRDRLKRVVAHTKEADLSKAFDCCDHGISLDKLYHFGISGVSHKLFSKFFHNRMQCTKNMDI